MLRGQHTGVSFTNLLRQVKVGIANGKTAAPDCKEAMTTEQAYYYWHRENGGLQVDQAKGLKELEQETSKRWVSEL